MSQDDSKEPDSAEEFAAVAARTRRWRWYLSGFVALLFVAFAIAWLWRKEIADDLIASQLEQLGLPATYEVARIGPGKQTLRNVVIGDPAKPDLTVEQVDVAILRDNFRPAIGRITLTRPRLYGVLRQGRVSFGSLDPLIYTGSKEPFQLPDLDLAIVDGRGLVESAYGSAGIKLAGAGRLRDGFAGELAAVSDGAAISGCTVKRITLFGKLAVSAQRPQFKGPLRLAGLECGQRGIALAQADIAMDATAEPRLDGAIADLSLRTGRAVVPGATLASLAGKANLAWRNHVLSARYDLAASEAASAQARAARLTLDGQLRAAEGFARIEAEGDARASGLALGPSAREAIAAMIAAGEGTLAGDVAQQIGAALAREMRAGQADARYIVRSSPESLNVLVPGAVVRGSSGEALVALSRLSMLGKPGAAPRIAANFSTGGAGLPRISGRMEQSAPGRARMLVRMAPYSAGSARIVLPQLQVVQAAHGGIGFAGEALVSGDLPGGRAENLRLPLDGNWSPRGGLALWRNCTDLRFDRLQLASLALDRRSLTVCPARGQAIVESGPAGLKLAGGIERLDLAGRLGGTPIRLRSGAVGFAMPGIFTARQVDVALGPARTASRFSIASLGGTLGGTLGGRFAGADVRLDAVPLDLLDASGRWTYRGGILALGDAAFRLVDREQVDRFQPLVARGATLRLASNIVTADALLREPETDREIARAEIRHNLANARGNARLGVTGILFDDALQPDTLSRQALGVVANVKGVVRGAGEIAWDGNGVTSTGAFATDALDFAAAFGPVEGLSGTVRFTDLLGLVTAPGQELAVASINPGIEVNDGLLRFELRPGSELAVLGARWPFLGGELRLKPTTLRIGTDHVVRYTLEIEGLDAARFIERMELANLAATGVFDGELPLVFDEDGGRIEGGVLRARPPGGNVAYVGELTYKDLSAMANFAFDALRSLDYREMTIGMDGALEGEIVTRVKLRGLEQGAGAARNLVTKRIAALPLQFDVNLRAPFFQLITSFKSLYDPEYVRDPRTLGLIDADRRIVPAAPLPNAPKRPVQPADSRNMP